MSNNKFLFAIKCKICHKEFVYCIKAGKDIRCYKCKEEGTSVEEIQAEIEAMDFEERRSFEQDIIEYNKKKEKNK